jgi:DNA mismatch repair protein MutL
MACRAAVKAHDRLSEKEARALIQRVLDSENPFTCPHGRPVMVELTRRDIEKMFKRIV